MRNKWFLDHEVLLLRIKGLNTKYGMLKISHNFNLKLSNRINCVATKSGWIICIDFLCTILVWYINNHFGHLSTRLFNNIERWMHLLIVLIYYAIICKAKTKTTNLSKQCTIKVNGVWTVRYSHRYIQIHEKPFLFCRVYIGSYPL